MIRLKPFKAAVIGVTLALVARVSTAEVVVVVSARSSLVTVTEDQVANVFLGRTSLVDNGVNLIPVDLGDDSPTRDEFYRKVTGKSPAQLKGYWSSLVFTGKAEPPREVANPAAVKKFLESTPSAIGYLNVTDVDARVRVVLTPR